MQDISDEALKLVMGGEGFGNAMRAGAVAGMGLVTGEQAPSFPRLEPQGQTQSGGGGSSRAPFQPLPLPGGGMATFGQ